MNKKLFGAALVALPLAVGGLVVAANSNSQLADKPAQVAEPFVCPVTGEELACPNCCPLNESKAE